MPQIIQLKPQHPGDNLDHAVQFGGWLGTDELATVAVVAQAGITLGTGPKAPVIVGDDVVLWLSGGTSGTTYTIEVTVTTTGARTRVQDCAILILDATP